MNSELRLSAILILLACFLMASPAITLADSCPTFKSYGDSSPNSLTLRSVDGVRKFYFENVYVFIGGTRSDVDVWFQPFGEKGSSSEGINQWGLEIDSFNERVWDNSSSNTFKAELKTYAPGSTGEIHCFSFPRKPGQGFGKQGEITIDSFTTGGGGGFFSAFASADSPVLNGHFRSTPFEFRREHADNVSRGGYEVKVKTNNIIKAENKSLGKGNQCRSDGGFHPLNKGNAIYNPQMQTLNLSLTGKQCNASFRLLDFPGTPGLYKGQVAFGKAKLYLIDKISGNHLKGEIWVIKEENFPGMENLTEEKVKSIGKAKAKFDFKNLIRHPKLEPLLISPE